MIIISMVCNRDFKSLCDLQMPVYEHLTIRLQNCQGEPHLSFPHGEVSFLPVGAVATVAAKGVLSPLGSHTSEWQLA